LAVAWSPDAERLATASMDGTARVWDPEKGEPAGQPLAGHKKWVLALAWEPLHLWREGTPRLVTASKDGTARIWVVNTGRTEHVLSGHKGSVSCVKWGAGGDGGKRGLVYTASHDKTVRVWDAEKGTLMHSLASHAHWVNHLALSTEFVLRTGYFERGAKDAPVTDDDKRSRARERYEKAARIQGKVVERLVSASDDYTMYLWDPLNEGTKPVARLMGHQKQVNHVSFSPDGTLIASAAWDNHTKLWNARYVSLLLEIFI
jgi:ribosome assembly protein 4